MGDRIAARSDFDRDLDIIATNRGYRFRRYNIDFLRDYNIYPNKQFRLKVINNVYLSGRRYCRNILTLSLPKEVNRYNTILVSLIYIGSYSTNFDRACYSSGLKVGNYLYVFSI